MLPFLKCFSSSPLIVIFFLSAYRERNNFFPILLFFSQNNVQFHNLKENYFNSLVRYHSIEILFINGCILVFVYKHWVFDLLYYKYRFFTSFKIYKYSNTKFSFVKVNFPMKMGFSSYFNRISFLFFAFLFLFH